jgi:hypothetical protein
VLAGTGGAAAYALGGDGDRPPPTSPATVTGREVAGAPTGAPAAAATGARAGAPTGAPTGRRPPTVVDRAVADLAEAVAAGAGVGRRRAGCVARAVVAAEGVERLVGAGVVTAEGRFLDPDLTGRPAVRRWLTLAARSCR